jgi:hypothetical protein
MKRRNPHSGRIQIWDRVSTKRPFVQLKADVYFRLRSQNLSYLIRYWMRQKAGFEIS